MIWVSVGYVCPSIKFSKILQLICHHCFQPGLLRRRVSERGKYRNAKPCKANTAAQQLFVTLCLSVKLLMDQLPSGELFLSCLPPPQGGRRGKDVACDFGEGNGTPLQYSCLENPMDGGAW